MLEISTDSIIFEGGLARVKTLGHREQFWVDKYEILHRKINILIADPEILCELFTINKTQKYENRVRPLSALHHKIS